MWFLIIALTIVTIGAGDKRNQISRETYSIQVGAKTVCDTRLSRTSDRELADIRLRGASRKTYLSQVRVSCQLQDPVRA